jgi:RNA polymerase sigma-70 factor, ECF subfamily
VSLTRDDSLRPGRITRRASQSQDSVIARVAQGNSAATRECIDEFGGLIWSIARRFSRTQADAEEAVGEIFADIWRNADRFDPAQGSERVFVATLARRRLIDRMRRAAHRAHAKAGSAAFSDQGVDAEPCVEAQAAGRAVMQLRPELQRVLQLGLLDGMSHSEIAEALQLPLEVVKTMMCRGLIQARELMVNR